MNARNNSSAAAEIAALRMRQRQIGRELRLFYERHTQDLLPDDMIEWLRKAELEADPDRHTPSSASSRS